MSITLTEHQAKYINSHAKGWIEALLSGEYKQTRGRMRGITKLDSGEEECSYCCLGVARECLIKSGAKQDDAADRDLLSINERDIIGLFFCNGYSSMDYLALTSLNDNEKWTFIQIANHLLQHPEAYFKEI